MSYAVDWIDLGKSSDKEIQVFLDYDSVKYSDVRVLGDSSSYSRTPSSPKYISAVFQHTYINKHPSRKKGFYYTKGLWVISCENESYFVKANIDYGFKDEVLYSWNSPKSILSSSDFNYAFAETIAGNNIEAACIVMGVKES